MPSSCGEGAASCLSHAIDTSRTCPPHHAQRERICPLGSGRSGPGLQCSPGWSRPGACSASATMQRPRLPATARRAAGSKRGLNADPSSAARSSMSAVLAASGDGPQTRRSPPRLAPSPCGHVRSCEPEVSQVLQLSSRGAADLEIEDLAGRPSRVTAADPACAACCQCTRSEVPGHPHKPPSRALCDRAAVAWGARRRRVGGRGPPKSLVPVCRGAACTVAGDRTAEVPGRPAGWAGTSGHGH